ncbi:MAG: hypothetical protein K5989_03115 [Lachnospiraceae bacterium]|nr:hypothetical protein [Lachnospiraceae bacterium]
MGGEILEFSVDKYYYAGLADGREEGLKEGKEEGLKKGREEGLKKGREEGLKKGREEGVKKGREEGVKEGREEGLKEGRSGGIKEGEHMMAKLVSVLLADGKADEVARVTKDEEYRDSLYKKYSILQRKTNLT